MIGGQDIIIDRKAQPGDLPALLDAIKKEWPEAMAEGSEDSPNQHFVYRDHAVLESWKKWGKLEENDDGMIHILKGPDTITLVVGSRIEALQFAYRIIDGLGWHQRHTLQILLTPAEWLRWKDWYDQIPIVQRGEAVGYALGHTSEVEPGTGTLPDDLDSMVLFKGG